MAIAIPDARSSLIQALKIATGRKLALIWVFYAAWIIVFVFLADHVGLWRNTLGKDTVAWSLTVGLAVLFKFPTTTSLQDVRNIAGNILGVTIFLEYLVNLVTFSIGVEIILQPVVAILLVAPIITKESQARETWRAVKNWSLGALGLLMLGLAAWTVIESWRSLHPQVFVLKAAWPFLLSIWILPLLFFLAVVGAYEQAFLKLQMSRPNQTGLWKAKLGLVLALRLRLKWVQRAAKGGTYHVARADTVTEAYEAAKHFKTEISKNQR